jgi:hypothetical protein
MHIDFCTVKAPKVIDDGYHKLFRKIGLEVEALKGFNSKACGVGLAE